MPKFVNSKNSLVLIMTLFASVQARSTDILVFHNGDQITGEITRIWDAEITIEPEYSDEFQVDVAAVAHIEAKRDFEIELTDGRKIVAQLLGGDEDGNQIMTVNGESISVPLADLAELDEPEDRFDWDSNIDWSTSFNTGNTESLDTKLRADTTFRIGDHRHIANLSFAREEQNMNAIKEQDLFNYNYNWLFRDDWFFSAAFGFERDPIRELDFRVVGSAGIGLDIWDDPRHTFNIQLGMGYTKEDIGGSLETSTVSIWRLRYRQDFFDEDFELYHDHSITRYLTGRDNTIYKTTTGLRFEITDLLYATASLDFDYETQPVESAVSEDVALRFGIGLEF